MAYSQNINRLLTTMCGDRSAEEVHAFLSRNTEGLSDKDSYNHLKDTAEHYKVAFTEVDHQELKRSIPSSKTMRLWLKKDMTPLSKLSETANRPASLRICSNPPTDMDVKFLRDWGIPKKEAARILGLWRSFHRLEEHDKCELFKRLYDDLTDRRIAFKQADALLETSLGAKEYNDDGAEDSAQIARAYRPWESNENYKVAYSELNLDESDDKISSD